MCGDKDNAADRGWGSKSLEALLQISRSNDVAKDVIDSERMKHIAHAANQVTRFEATLARMYAEQHPNDPVVVGYHAATKNLDNLTDASIIRGHLRLLEQIGKNK